MKVHYAFYYQGMPCGDLPAREYAGAQAWIGSLLRGVRFSAE
ncbi:MAG: hypothetical protein ABSA30_04895 [Candidatus Aminicenantales bacterium]